MSNTQANFVDSNDMSAPYPKESITVTHTHKGNTKTIKFDSFQDLAKLKDIDAS